MLELGGWKKEIFFEISSPLYFKKNDLQNWKEDSIVSYE